MPLHLAGALSSGQVGVSIRRISFWLCKIPSYLPSSGTSGWLLLPSSGNVEGLIPEEGKTQGFWIRKLEAHMNMGPGSNCSIM